MGATGFHLFVAGPHDCSVLVNRRAARDGAPLERLVVVVKDELSILGVRGQGKAEHDRQHPEE